MTTEIKIDVAQLKKQVERLDSALKNFDGYGKQFLQQAQDSLEPFNSDFTVQAKTLLSFMEDTNFAEAKKKIQDFRDGLEQLGETFVQTDEQQAKELRQ